MTQEPASNARPRRARARARNQRPFLALDGEGAESATGRHAYVTMSSSSGRSIVDPNGISTRDALAFMLREAAGKPGPIVVGFFFNYDVNMILRDVPLEKLAELWRQGSTIVELGDAMFEIEWIPTKLFTVYGELPSPLGWVDAHAKLYDVFGFFQSSFVKACKAWGLGDELARIERFKARRGSFGRTDRELADLCAYSVDECRVLVELMGRVRDALHAVDLRPRTWLGAGAIASTLLARERVQDHLTPPAIRVRRPALDDAIMRAYFGGRTEVFQQGIHPAATSADINSAYPAAAIELPSERGSWKRRREYDPSAQWAIWRVAWELPRSTILAPFPFRHKRAIYWPRAGEGIYHAAEVAAAIELYGDAIRVTSGYVFEPVDDARPFAFLRDVYAYRLQLKADDHPGEKVLKLGINSVYGKLAQGTSRDGRPPKFQSYFWAGAITAQTRARVLAACALDPERVVAVATDGIVYAPRQPRELRPAPGLGGWELTNYRDFFVCQPGMYDAIERRSNTRVRHSRGFFARELDFPTLRRLWLERGPVATWPSRSTRFVGLGSALLRKEFSVWQQWVDGERRVSLYLAPRKRYVDEEPEPSKRLWPPDAIRAGLSDVYVPKYAVIELDDDAADWIAGQEQPTADV